MAQTYLISKTTFSEYEDVAVNIEAFRLQVFIKKAQDLDLKPFMGNIFFYDFIKWFNPDGAFIDDTPQYYIDLFNGVDYQDRNGNELYFDGLKPALVYWTFARFIEADSFRYTATGPVIKQHDEADTLKPADIAKLVQQQRSTANAHVNDIINYLDNKRDVYVKWRYNERNTQSRQPGPRIRGVDRTDVRRVYGPNSNFPYGPNGFLDGLIG